MAKVTTEQLILTKLNAYLRPAWLKTLQEIRNLPTQ